MKKTLLITFLLLFLLASCQKEKLQLPAKKVYIIATHPIIPNYEEETGDPESYERFRTVGVVEVSQDMKAKTVRWEGKYFSDKRCLSADLNLSDTMKMNLVDLVEEYQQDTIFEPEEYIAEFYDGPIFLIAIEKEDDEYIFISPERDSDPPMCVTHATAILRESPGMKNLVFLESEEAKRILAEKTEVLLKTFAKQVGGIFPPPPPPLKSTVRFVPPVILPDEE